MKILPLYYQQTGRLPEELHAVVRGQADRRRAPQVQGLVQAGPRAGLQPPAEDQLWLQWWVPRPVQVCVCSVVCNQLEFKAFSLFESFV